MFFSAVLALALRVLLVFENRKLDRKYGRKSIEEREKGKDAAIAVEDYGPNFRYVL